MKPETFDDYCREAAKHYEDYLDYFSWQMVHEHPQETMSILCQLGMSHEDAHRMISMTDDDMESSSRLLRFLAKIPLATPIHKLVENYVYRMMYDESPDFYDEYTHIVAEEEAGA